jgi:hypothetical protein
VDLTGSALGSIDGCCEFCNELASFMNSGRYLDILSVFSLKVSSVMFMLHKIQQEFVKTDFSRTFLYFALFIVII